MLMDNSLILDTTLTLTTSGSSTNYIDTIGAGGGQAQISGINTIQGGYDAYEQLWWEVLVTTTVTGVASGSVQFQLWTSSNVAQIWTTGNAGSQPVVSSVYPNAKLADSGAIPIASLIAGGNNEVGRGYTYRTRLAQGCQRYIAGWYQVVSAITGLTAGAWSSFLIPDIDINLT